LSGHFIFRAQAEQTPRARVFFFGFSGVNRAGRAQPWGVVHWCGRRAERGFDMRFGIAGASRRGVDFFIGVGLIPQKTDPLALC